MSVAVPVFVGREWLFDAVDAWIDAPQERFLIVTGGSGTGKSAFANALARRRNDIKASHACVARYGGTVNPAGAVRSLSRQLCANVPGFQAAILATATPNHIINGVATVAHMSGGVAAGVAISIAAGGYAEDVFEMCLRSPLAFMEAPAEPIVLLIDALDESLKYSGKPNLVGLLESSGDLPPWIRWICTTQPKDDVLSGLAGSQATVISIESEADVWTYVRSRVSAQSSATGAALQMGPTAAADLVRQLARGNFLYAQLLLENGLPTRSASGDCQRGGAELDASYYRTALARLSQGDERTTGRAGLDEFFGAALAGLVHGADQQAGQALLGVLAVAREPLTVEQLCAVTGIARAAAERIATVLRPFLAGEAGLSLFHESLREFLLGSASGALRVDSSASHALLADYCCSTVARADSAFGDDYHWRWLALHLVLAGRTVELRKYLVDYSYLENKLRSADVDTLISDYDYFAGDADLRLMQDALRLAGGTVAGNPQHLASQLVGRLLPYARRPQVAAFIASATAHAPRPWLRPLAPALRPPGTGLVRTLRGHRGGVGAVTITHDGRRAISAARDSTLKVWDIASGRELRTIACDAGWLHGVALTPDDACVLAACDDGTVRAWELNSGRALMQFRGHKRWVYALALTPDGRSAVSAAADQTLQLWEVATGRVRWSRTNPTETIRALAVTPDGRSIVSGSYQTVDVWDLERGKRRALGGHADWVKAVAVTPDGRWAVTGSKDTTLKVWNLETGRELLTYRGHSAEVCAVALTPDGRSVISAGEDRTLDIWDLASGRNRRSLAGHVLPVQALAISPDGLRVISGSEDDTLKVWDLASDPAVLAYAPFAYEYNGIAVTPDSKRVVLAAWETHSAIVRELSFDAPQITVLRGHDSWVQAVALSPDGRCAVTASSDHSVKLWLITDGSELRTLHGHRAEVADAAFSADGRYVISGSHDKTLKIWDFASGSLLRTLEGHTEIVRAVDITRDGRFAISGSADKTLKIWDVASSRCRATLRGHDAPIADVALTPDGALAISASDDSTLAVWAVPSGRRVRTLNGHARSVYAVSVTPDGKRALSASHDRTLRLWEIETGQTIATFAGDAAIQCCTAAADGTYAAADAGGALYHLSLEGAAPGARPAGAPRS